jgi:GNAT superfamily N-acetyltransferase
MTSEFLPTPARVAGPEDIDAVVDTLTKAFFEDPVWGPAFPDAVRRSAQAAAMWRVYVTSAMRYPWTLVTENVEAAAVWIPPGGAELTEQEEGELKTLLLNSAGPEVAEGIMAIYDQFEAAMPSEPHFYLTLLGTHDDHRGKGLGMGLVMESLARIDALGAPAYLESSNPANDARYERVGFARDRFTIAATGHVVTTMWRPAQRSATELA